MAGDLEKAQLSVEVLTPEGALFEGQARMITLPGVEGRFTVLPGHAPIISALQAGEIRIVEAGGGERRLGIREGFVHVLHNRVQALVFQAED